MNADVKPHIATMDDLNLSGGALHADGSAAAAAMAAAGSDILSSPPAGDVDMEDRSGGVGDVDSSGVGTAEMANTVHRLGVNTEHIRKLLSDQGLPTDAVMCAPMLFLFH